MTDHQTKHPLHGVGLKPMLIELVRHYDWHILAEQIPLKCFSSYPNITSCVKFLHKTSWARERVEAFYLYRYKNISLPSEEQHSLPPREREISLDELDNSPAEIREGDAEFFDDPITGPKMPSKKDVERTRAKQTSKVSRRQSQNKHSDDGYQRRDDESKSHPRVKSHQPIESNKPTKSNSTSNDSGAKTSDPWAKWRG